MTTAGGDGTASPAPPATHGTGYRGDIDGLRAIAVLLVVAFHAEVAPFRGGFIGVDSFFVISGFLITGLLLTEIRRHGRIAFIQFWLRRARRLFPALAVVVTATVVLAYLFFASPVTLPEVVRQAASATLYVSNLRFATTLQDYFRADVVRSSPYLHTWSLGIEEQFYLFWPVLLMVTVVAARLIRTEARRAIVLVMGAVSIVSFALCVRQSNSGSPWAFFGLHTRAWEFGLAGILAAYPLVLSRRSAFERAALGWVGLLAVLGSAALYGEDTVYPGTGVMVPVLGTLLLVAAGAGPTRVGPARLLDTSILRTLGRWSFAWYLWHWPLLVFLRARVADPSLAARLGVVAVSLGLAWVTHHLIENPIRFSPVLAASRLKTAGVALAFCVLALAVTGGVNQRAKADARSPLVRSVIAATRDFGARCTVVDDVCALGALGSERTVVVVGDSHAEQWLPALDEVGKTLGLRVLPRTFRACPPYDVTLSFKSRTTSQAACTQFNRDTAELLERIQPVAVVAAASSGQFDFLRAEIVSPDGTASSWAAWESAIARYARARAAAGAEFGIILDTPRLEFNPSECVALRRSFTACEPTREDATEDLRDSHDAERAAARAEEFSVFDPLPLLCDDRCPLQRAGKVVFKDPGHMTASFNRTLAPAIEPFVRRLTEGSRRS